MTKAFNPIVYGTIDMPEELKKRIAGTQKMNEHVVDAMNLMFCCKDTTEYNKLKEEGIL